MFKNPQTNLLHAICSKYGLTRSSLKLLAYRSDPEDCTWSGHWMSARDARNVYCKYYPEGKCGSIDCSGTNRNTKSFNSSIISGANCDRLEMWGYSGKATCGHIVWLDGSNEIVHSWYKTTAHGTDQQVEA